MAEFGYTLRLAPANLLTRLGRTLLAGTIVQPCPYMTSRKPLKKSAKSPTKSRTKGQRTAEAPAPESSPSATDGQEIEEASFAEPDATEQELIPEGKLVCALTGEHRTATPQEETLQSFIEQLHREYDVALADMARDVRVSCARYDETKGKERLSNRNVSLMVYEPGESHVAANATHVAIVAKPGTKSDKKAIEVLDDVLANVGEERPMVFGIWTNGTELQIRLRTWNQRTGNPDYAYLADFPGPGERLEDLENADRRPLRVAAGDSLLRAFKRCHDYLYGNQSMRGDRAFWQLLNLIFCKIHDEAQSRRKFFVGATEGYDPAGQKAIATRIHSLFEEVKSGAYKDVFDGTEKIELNDRALAYVAGELSRYSLLSTDTDAKGMAYEAITSTTLKRERGQFFTPRNVIQMMVEMADPQPGQRILDPACGSGGFLVVALAHERARLLEKLGVPRGASAVPSELKRIERDLKAYARECLYGLDVDPDLRKAARMNMVMNNDGHGNIFEMNSLEFNVPGKQVDAWSAFTDVGGGHGKFDYVFTNPPFGSKIPVSDTEVLQRFELGHQWTRTRDGWQKGKLLKKVPPEILFIEACWKYLKPGTGVMALVLPNGILGNPGEQMEAVRWWMLRNMELLASVDLPGEAFLPQVSVQASCVFLRRRDPDELRLTDEGGPAQRPVFMAVAEACGHGRRGETTWARHPDGTERIEPRDVLERWEKHGKVDSRVRQREERVLADDMPWIARQYQLFANGQPIESA
ncbi:MAG: SAM-dependent methyltransferase [Gemmatimonadaceae bacterium]|nr:SAM-dependent methyltransferase [Gemmatimonadaceae bacterium]